MNKTQLIFITALIHFDNLIYLAKNLNRYYDEYSEYFDIIWLICKDKYNGYGSLDKFFEYIQTTNINWQMYDSGQKQEKNYGGALFNYPLTDIVNRFQLQNPFVYVFDDDNIIHPNLLPTMKIYQENNFDNKEVIVLNCVFDEGYLKPLYKENINIPTHTSFIDGMNIVDPSSVILRYSIIEKYGMYKASFDYDFTWLLNILNEEIKSNNVLTAMDLVYMKHISPFYAIRNSYHNHLNAIKDTTHIDSIKDVNADDLVIDINISTKYDKHSNKKTLNFPILTKETKEKIKELIYQEINIIKGCD